MAWLEVDYFNNLGPIDSRITILLTVLGYNLLGESLRDLADPRLRR